MPESPRPAGSTTTDQGQKAGATAGTGFPGRIGWSGVTAWFRTQDPGLLAVKRSARAAVFVPLVFGIAHLVSSNSQLGLFAAFGSFALLLLVDFAGRRPRTRLSSYAILFVTGAVFITLGTAVSTDKALSVVAMAVVGFAVLFAGIVSPQAATASTAALLLFVLPVAVAQPASAVGPRLLGWALAGVLCLPACMLIWPTPWHDNLRRRLSATVSSLADLTQAHAEGRVDPSGREKVTSELTQLRSQFAGTPYPPTGAAARAVALAKLVGRVEWIAEYAVVPPDQTTTLQAPMVRRVIGSVAETLRRTAALICDASAHPVEDPALIAALQQSTQELDRLIVTDLDAEVATLIDPNFDLDEVGRSVEQDSRSTGHAHRRRIVSALDPSFRARALGTATEMVADATLEGAGAQAVGDRRLGALGEPASRQLLSRVLSHLSFRSVWFRNAIRGAMGLALAVAVVEVTDVEHGFWVVLGTLSVLRSNALGTGATALRAIAGTTVGFLVGSALMIGIAGHSVALWGLLPVAVLVSGMAPSMISFAAGQAGFTVVVVILFNIIDPTGWEVGLTRIEDVAIGCGVSIVVGVLFWPRGATAALGRALSDAFAANSGYLTDAVDRLTITNREIDCEPGQRASHRAYLRLDDAFRQFLAERGAKVVHVDAVAQLVTGSNRIRLAAFTLSELPRFPPDPGQPELESVTIAGAVLRDSFASNHRWYQEFAELLSDRRRALDPPPRQDKSLDDVLQRAFAEARSEGRSDGLRKTLQMLWADELLEAESGVQADLASSADLFVHGRSRGLLV